MTSGEELIIESLNEQPSFEVSLEGLYTIHTLVYNPNTLDLGQVEVGVTSGFDVNSLLVQGGGSICAALDVAGAKFQFGECDKKCEADAGSLIALNAPCLFRANAFIAAAPESEPVIPAGFELRYVLTRSDSLIILELGKESNFNVFEEGNYRIHTLIYDPETLDLDIVVPGQTTGFDVNGLLIQGGGTICGALDVNGALFIVHNCECEADEGELELLVNNCLQDGESTIGAKVKTAPVVPEGFTVTYLLTTHDELIVQNINTEPTFQVSDTGLYRIHTLVYDPDSLDLNTVTFGETNGFQLNRQLNQGGGSICAAFDLLGLEVPVAACTSIDCGVTAGELMPRNEPCLRDGYTALRAFVSKRPQAPKSFEILYVLTSGDELVILDVNHGPVFPIRMEGTFRIHTLVYDPETLDLGVVEFGTTTGFDVNSLLIQGGGDICGALDVEGVVFEVEECKCDASAGTLTGGKRVCLQSHGVKIAAHIGHEPFIPHGFEVIYVLTSGDGLVIEAVNELPRFTVEETGTYTIHSLVYNPHTLDLGIVNPGQTTGFDVNALLIQGGGDICAALDVQGTRFEVRDCSHGFMNIRPNPTAETITIDLPENQLKEGFNIQILSAFGQTYQVLNLDELSESTVELDLKDLPAGTYYIKLLKGATELEMRTLVKQ